MIMKYHKTFLPPPPLNPLLLLETLSMNLCEVLCDYVVVADVELCACVVCRGQSDA